MSVNPPDNAGPQVSVVLPTRNRARTLNAAIASVLAQSFVDFELIVVDDASTDDTRRVVDACNDQRIRYIAVDRNVGAAAARNRGLQAARGHVIAFQDSDDVWRPERLRVQVDDLLKKPYDVGVSVGGYTLATGHRDFTAQYAAATVGGREWCHRMLRGAYFPTPAMLVRAATLRDAGGFDEALPRRQDFDLCIRLATRCSFSFVTDVVVEQRYSADSMSRDADLFEAATLHIIETHRDVFEGDRAGCSFQLYETAKYLAFAGKTTRARAHLKRALQLDPANWRAAALLVTIITGTSGIARRLRG